MNHASAFSAWGALIALGLALEEPKRKIKAGLLIIACFCVVACVSSPSRGGLLVLGLGLIGFLIALRWGPHKKSASVSTGIVGALVLVGSIAAVFQRALLKREFDDGFSVDAKIGDIRGAGQMIQDHLGWHREGLVHVIVFALQEFYRTYCTHTLKTLLFSMSQTGES